jgi:hypothetical protein
VHDPEAIIHGLRDALVTSSLYAQSAGNVLVRGRTWAQLHPSTHTGANIFVVGSPRSGTTFMGRVLGAQRGCVDLGEVKPIKAAIPRLVALPDENAARQFRRILERVRRLGFASRLRGVEQTPETSFVLGAALRAFPEGRAVHMLRDGRDVVASLLERSWLSDTRLGGTDDVGQAYGGHARFWVEEDRREEFLRSSEATRAAWAWRRYATAASASSERTLEVRYEELVADPRRVAERLAEHLDLDADSLARSLSEAHGESVGRWQRDLTPEQVADVEREAGELLVRLGYGGR